MLIADSILNWLPGFGAHPAIVAVGLTMIAYGTGLLCLQVFRSRDLREAKGTVVGWKRENDALVSFQAEDGSQHELVTTVLATAKQNMKIGAPFPLPVIYDTRHPDAARIGRLAFGWIVPWVWGALGCGTLMMATVGPRALAEKARNRIHNLDLIDALAAVGLITTVIGMTTLIRRLAFLRRSDKAGGKLIGWKDEKRAAGRSWRTFYRPIVSFEAADGSVHTVMPDWAGGTKSETAIGRPYPVRYDPHDPADAYIATAANLWAMPVVLLLIGGFLLALGLQGR